MHGPAAAEFGAWKNEKVFPYNNTIQATREVPFFSLTILPMDGLWMENQCKVFQTSQVRVIIIFLAVYLASMLYYFMRSIAIINDKLDAPKH
jgi:hypothetical protein